MSTPQQDAKALYQAIKEGDERTIIGICKVKANAQRLEIVKAYKDDYCRDLLADFKSLKGNFGEAMIALFTDPIEYDADELRKAMEGFWTNEDTIIEIIASRPQEILREVKEKYNKKYKRDLEKDVHSKTSGTPRKLLLSLLQCNRSNNTQIDTEKCKSIAKEIFKAGEARLGTDDSVFIKYFCTLSREELQQVSEDYKQLSPHNIFEAINKEFSGDSKKTLRTIVDAIRCPPEYFAERVHDAIKGILTIDHHLLIRVLVSRSEIDMPQIKQYYKQNFKEEMYIDVKKVISGNYRILMLQIIG